MGNSIFRVEKFQNSPDLNSANPFQPGTSDSQNAVPCCMLLVKVLHILCLSVVNLFGLFGPEVDKSPGLNRA